MFGKGTYFDGKADDEAGLSASDMPLDFNCHLTRDGKPMFAACAIHISYPHRKLANCTLATSAYETRGKLVSCLILIDEDCINFFLKHTWNIESL